MILLRLISWQYVRKHKFRWCLTVIGIAIGIAVLVGMHTANQSVLFAFQRTIDRIAGTTQLQVSAGEAGFPEEILEKVQSLRDVRAAAPVIEAPVNTGFKAQGNILILGVDMTGDRNVRDYDLEDSPDGVIDDPLVFLAQPDSIIITRSFADQTGLKMNARVPMNTMVGEKQFTVRGIMKSGGLASAFGGNLAIMDIYSAQKIFGRGRHFDRIDIMVKDGVSEESVQTRLRDLLGPNYLVDKPSARGQQFESTAKIYSLVSSVTSLFALFIGMFIIYNTFEIAVTQRRSEIGILRALGATQRQIRALFIVESAIAGIIGSLLGILAGLAVAQLIAASISGTLGEMYGIAQRAEEIAADPRLLLSALIAGTLTSIIAAVIPAWDAARVDPVKALQKGRQQSVSARENRIRRNLALASLAAAVVCMFFASHRVMFYAGYLLAVMASVLIVPAAAGVLARMLRPLMKAILPVEGALAADSLIEAPRRTAGTVTALMLCLGLVIALAGSSRGSYETIRKWLTVALNPDLFVTTSESLTTRSFVFPPEVGDLLKTVPGIETMQRVRSVKIVIRDVPVMLVALEVDSIRKRVHLPFIAGDEKTAWDAAMRGEGVIASDNFAILRGYKIGDMVDLPSPDGVLKLPIVGIIVDYSDQQGSLVIDRSLYVKHWQDEGVNMFRLYLAKGAVEADVRQKLQEAVGARSRLFVFTNKDLRDYILRLTDQWFSITYIQILVAMIVAVLGIVNTLTVSISDRKRELGVLQAVGGLRNQIRRTIWMEAFVIGLIGLILGLIVGAVQLFFIVEMARRDIAGIRLDYIYPFSLALLLVPGILVVAFLAAIGPAEAAVRGSLVEALEYE